MKPLSVCILSVVPSPYQRDLFAALAKCPEIELSVYYLEDASPDSPWPRKPLADYEKILDGKWYALGSVRWHRNWNLPEVDDFDVVIINSFMSSAAQKLMRNGLRDRGWIFWAEALREQKVGWKRWVQMKLTEPISNASAIAAIGSRAKSDYEKRFPGVGVHNIPYHCDLSEFQRMAEGRVRTEKVRFLFCGQLIVRKGVDILLAAFSEVAKRHSNVQLVLVGREAELDEFLSKLPEEVRALIVYRGFKSPDDLPAEFASADVFLLPSRYDGWGVVVNQALGAAMPIICSEQVGAGFDLVSDGKNGFRFEVEDSGGLAERMTKYVENRELINLHGQESKRLAAEWSPENGAEKFGRLLQEVIQ